MPLPDSLTAPLPPLPPAADGSLRALIINHADVAERYHQCAARVRSLIAAAGRRECR